MPQPLFRRSQAGAREQGPPVPTLWADDRAGQPSVVRRYDLHPDDQGFLSLVVIMDWVSRAALARRLSNTLGADFCVEALEDALEQYGKPEIFNPHQGCQFNSIDFARVLERGGVTINMEGKSRCMVNIFVARLWRDRCLVALLQRRTEASEPLPTARRGRSTRKPVDM
jgi:transposase InsO family protein